MSKYIIFPICVVFILLGILLVRRILWKNRQTNIINDSLERIIEAVGQLERLLNDTEYFNNKKLVEWNCNFDKAGNGITPLYGKIGLEKSKKSSLDRYYDFLSNGRKYIDEHNIKYQNTCINENKSFFDTVESYPLDINQRIAIVHEEDANLVVAGAGCGKTTTLIGKLAYLTKIKNVPKESILMLAFTRKAANEMKERISKRLGEDFEVYTFHSFGYKLLSEIRDKKPSLAFDDNNTLDKCIRNILNEQIKSKDFAKMLVEFFFYEFTVHLPDRKNKSNLTSYLGEIMKSKQEVKIANFLYVHKIRYEYEREYEVKTVDKNYRQYQPDFYLPDYHIYIEHFGIDENGKPSSSFENGKSYIEGMHWKRKTHLKHGTILVETYSYEDIDNGLQSNLRHKLESHNVSIQEVDFANTLKNDIKKNDRTLLIEIICTFLNLFKSNSYSFTELDSKALLGIYSGLYRAFLNLFKPIYDAYETNLRNIDKIDFNDMIAEATKYVSEKKYESPYKYVLIDEYQDISVGRYNLIKALLKQNPDTQLFCVGDDWQSIFRFAGSDISLFVKFQNYFGYHKLTRIEKTYRLSEEIANYTNGFILKNKDQIEKNLSSEKKLNSSPYKIFYKKKSEDTTVLIDVLKLIKSQIKPGRLARVLILGRYNWDEPIEMNSLKAEYKNYDINVEFLTVHKAKGLEADYVILNNVVQGTHGFPSQLLDHEILNLVLQEREDYPFAEERRLFYVAMTRSKNESYIIGKIRNVSEFIFDLNSLNDDETKSKLVESKLCPNCHGQLVSRKSKYGEFIGCENYPSCTFKKDRSQDRVKEFLEQARVYNNQDDDLPF